jgi:chitodextrinase
MLKYVNHFKYLIILILSVYICISDVDAATIQAASCSQADVAAAISQASDGDTVAIPAGACTWSSTLTINSISSRTKMVKLIGAGTDPSTGTRITCNVSGVVLKVWLHRNLSGFRLSNIRFIQNVTVGEEDSWGFWLAGHADTYASLFRIDHCYFQYATGSYSNVGWIGMLNSADSGGTNDTGHPYIWGVVDNNTFSGTVSFQGIDVGPDYDITSPGNYTYRGHGAWRDWLIADHSGTWENVFFEDNTFTSTGSIDSQAALDADAGSAVVIRHNFFKNNWIANHGADSSKRSVKWSEIYDNIFVKDTSAGAWYGAMNIRGGTGVYYNNRIYDASHKGTGNRYGITGTDNYDYTMMIQYYREFGAYGGDGICADAICGQDPKLGCDNKDDSTGWICRDQPGAKKGTTQSGWAYGYNWATEPLVYWANYYADTSNLMSVDISTPIHILVRRDIINQGDCTGHMGETICSTFWDDVNNKKKNYTPYTYPHPLRNEGPPDTQAPTTPTNLSASAISSSQINLAWTASTDNVGVTGYRIYRNGTQINTTSNTSYQDTGLSPSTTYSYTVAAYDAAGNVSGQSTTASATTQASSDTIPPSIPTNLSAIAVSSSQINISWTASTDNVGVAGYRIYRNGAQITTTANTAYSDTGLSPSTTYNYTVAAYDAAGNTSAQSNTASATTQAPSPTITIGETNILSLDDSGNANLLLAQSASLSQSATIQSISFYVATATGKLRLGVYDSTGPSGGPGAKKAETNEITTTTGWNTANVITPVLLPAGNYWIAYLPSDSNLHFRGGASGTCRYYSYTYGVMPATFSTSPSSVTYHWSFYATLNTQTGNPPPAPPAGLGIIRN